MTITSDSTAYLGSFQTYHKYQILHHMFFIGLKPDINIVYSCQSLARYSQVCYWDFTDVILAYEDGNLMPVDGLTWWICSSPTEDLLPHLSQVCSLISNEVESGGTVLVHCVAGVSRWRGRCKNLKLLFLFLIVWNHSSLIFSYFLIARKDLFKERLFCSCLPDLQLQPHLKWGDPRHS